MAGELMYPADCWSVAHHDVRSRFRNFPLLYQHSWKQDRNKDTYEDAREDEKLL